MNTSKNLQEAFTALPNITEAQSLAFDRFNTTGFPHRKLEAFKYTKLNAKTYQNFIYQAPNVKNVALTQAPRFFASSECIYLDVIDGVLIQSDLQEKGFSLRSSYHLDLTSSIERKPLQNTSSWNSLNDLNLAFSTDGFYIQVNENHCIEKPIVIHHHVSEKSNAQAIHNRNFLHLCSGSQATVVEIFDSSMASNHYFQNQVLNVVCEKNSHVKLVLIQNDSLNSIHQSCIDLIQGQGSQSEVYSFAFGSENFRLDASTQLNRRNAYTKLNGLYISQSQQNHDHFTNIYHGQAHTHSEELFKGILNDTAHASFTGKIVVEKDAQKIESKQMNRNLMLSPNAQVDSAPQLEIFADDVKCAHGSTIGELNPEEMFYLRSRGLSELEAKKALIRAYAKDVIDQTKLPFLQAFIEDLLLEKLSITP